jgi:hypothetical protein
MTNVYETSLALMDAYLDSVSDDEFLCDYLSAEQFKGPLVKEFLSEYYVFTYTYEVRDKTSYVESISRDQVQSRFDLNYCIQNEGVFEAKGETLIVHTKNIEYSASLHAANDDYCQTLAA